MAEWINYKEILVAMVLLNNFIMKKFWIIIYSLLLPVTSLADEGGGGGSVRLTNYLKDEYESVPCLIKAILDIIVQIGSVVLVVFIVITGLMFVMAKGNSTKLEEAKKALFWTIIGAAIVLGAFVISEAIQGTVDQLGDIPDGSPAACEAPAN